MPIRFFCVLSAAFLFSGVGSCIDGAAPRPNIVFILTDDLGYGDLGVYFQNERAAAGKPAQRTPELDRFAAEGARFTQHYTAAPVCAPARASLLTGRHQGHADVRDSEFDKALEDTHTLASVLKAAGYRTAVIGKWGLQGQGVPREQAGHPLKRGFDSFFGITAHLSGHYHYAQDMKGQKDNQGQPTGIFDGYKEVTGSLKDCYSTDLYTARAKQWLAEGCRKDPKQPFFLYLTYTAPHARLDIPCCAWPEGSGLKGGVQWTGKSGRMINTAVAGKANSWLHPDYANATWDHDANPATPQQPWPEFAKRHATMVRRLDDAVADLVQTLKDLGHDRDTLIVFTSDNGPTEESGAHGKYTDKPDFLATYGPLDGIKRDLLDGGLRVPALVRWPDGIPAGGVIATPSQFHDWMATFAEFAGVPCPAKCDGASLVPSLTGRGVQRPGIVYSECRYDGSTPAYADFKSAQRGKPRGQMQTLWVDGLKGLRYRVKSADDAFSIFDLANDPHETRNLAPAKPALASFLKDEVLRVRRPSPTMKRPYDDACVPALADAPAVAPGLLCRVTTARLPWVPDFDTVPTQYAPVPAKGPDASIVSKSGVTGAEFSGFVRVPSDGEYEFRLRSQADFSLRLHRMLLLDGEGEAKGGIHEATAKVRLSAGLHPIRLSCRRDAASVSTLDLSWRTDGGEWKAIPAEAYARVAKWEPR